MRPCTTPPSILVMLILLLGGTGCDYFRTKHAQHDVDQLELALKVYLVEHRRYPQGDAGEICRLLLGENIRGQNPQRLGYIDAEPDEINDRHEFVDPWGNPYRLVMRQQPFVYSLGPNQADDGGAGDDIVAGEAPIVVPGTP